MNLEDAINDTIHLMDENNVDDYIDLVAWLFDVDDDVVTKEIRKRVH